jgi:hydrogenase expression/formation protein HypE
MQVSRSYPLGKLPADHLSRLLDRYAPTDPDVVVGPRVGEDAAVVALTPGRYLVAKSDPITFATDEIGWYAVHVNANDLACCGAVPRWWMAAVLLPEGKASPELVDTIFHQFAQACGQVGAQLVGGHTEITYGLDRPIVVGTMLGEVEPGGLVSTDGARPGDVLLLTKGIAVEGTAIIAREKRAELAGRVPDALLARCAGFLHEPGISVVPEAQLACRVAGNGVHAMHDPTEGGVITGLHELAAASGCGLEVVGHQLPVLPETRAVCEPFGLDPLGLIASGSLLAAVAPGSAGELISALREAGIQAADIGRVLPAGAERVIIWGDERRPLPMFPRDELARLFDGGQVASMEPGS